VAKVDKEEHDEECMKMIKCKFCSHTARATVFGNHEETCEMKPRKCMYCDDIFTIERLMDHQEPCGGRTYKCDECGRYVCRKDKEGHLING